jgi:hypothetical protein
MIFSKIGSKERRESVPMILAQAVRIGGAAPAFFVPARVTVLLTPGR